MMLAVSMGLVVLAVPLQPALAQRQRGFVVDHEAFTVCADCEGFRIMET